MDQEQINVTFRSIGQYTTSCPLRAGVVCCLPSCAQGSSAVVTGIVGCSLGSCAHGGYWLCWNYPSYLQDSGYGGVLIAGHAVLAEVGGGIICVTLGEFTGVH